MVTEDPSNSNFSCVSQENATSRRLRAVAKPLALRRSAKRLGPRHTWVADWAWCNAAAYPI